MNKIKNEIVKISEIELNNGQIEGLPKNPRFIKDEKFEKLVISVSEFPEMLSIRPIVVDENMVILGGNMRYRACKVAGIKEIPIIIAEGLTIEQKCEFLIKDNVSGGDWDWEEIESGWSKDLLDKWGLDTPFGDAPISDEELYTKKIKAPTYEPSDFIPPIQALFDEEKSNRMIAEIEESNLEDEVKEFLIKASRRHVVFDYQKIADFYAHSDKETQSLMEKSALVIIDFDKAIENGYVKLSDDLRAQYSQDYEE
jgi:hypothetical protein